MLLELAFPGCPAFFAGAPELSSTSRPAATPAGRPRTTCSPRGATQLAHFYGVPMAMGTMATSAKEPDWQAAVDDSLCTFASVMTCADMMNGCGLLNGSKILSYPHMVMETEIYGIVQKVAGGVVSTTRRLALDVIAKVGPNGTYLAEKHTRRHMKEIWRPTVWDRTPYDVWLPAARRAPSRRRPRSPTTSSRTTGPSRCPSDVAGELAAIVARADAELAA